MAKDATRFSHGNRQCGTTTTSMSTRWSLPRLCVSITMKVPHPCRARDAHPEAVQPLRIVREQEEGRWATEQPIICACRSTAPGIAGTRRARLCQAAQRDVNRKHIVELPQAAISKVDRASGQAVLHLDLRSSSRCHHRQKGGHREAAKLSKMTASGAEHRRDPQAGNRRQARRYIADQLIRRVAFRRASARRSVGLRLGRRHQDHRRLFGVPRSPA